ncbi:hypothetical protein SAQ01S_18520 [Sphingomonas aquatilis NBRC 16722]|nr:hypothetical protein SAQ01S_18520 [Sphingomonas aquatilis NBRC 16722]
MGANELGLDPLVILEAVELERTHRSDALAVAQARLNASYKYDDIDFWSAVCAYLAVRSSAVTKRP